MDTQWKCPECGEVFDSPFEGVWEGNDCCFHLLPVEGCNCYKCTEPKYMENGSLQNNMEYHTYGEECNKCGAEKTKYRDLGTKGRFVCPECF